MQSFEPQLKILAASQRELWSELDATPQIRRSFSPSITLKALMYYEDGTLPNLPATVRQRLMQEARKVKTERIPHLIGHPGLSAEEGPQKQ